VPPQLAPSTCPPPTPTARRTASTSSVNRSTVQLAGLLGWSERPLSAAGDQQGIAVMDLFELVAEAAGIEVGGSTGAAVAQGGAR